LNPGLEKFIKLGTIETNRFRLINFGNLPKKSTCGAKMITKALKKVETAKRIR
jgi:hypothetical protein